MCKRYAYHKICAEKLSSNSYAGKISSNSYVEEVIHIYKLYVSNNSKRWRKKLSRKGKSHAVQDRALITLLARAHWLTEPLIKPDYAEAESVPNNASIAKQTMSYH
jgi:hypothetical protein